MAFTLSTIYTAVDRYSPVLKKMEQANAGFAGRVFNAKQQLLGLAGGVSVASLAFMGYRAITNYDDAIQSLSAVTGVVGKDLVLFKREILDLADKSKKSAVDIAKGFEIVGSNMSQYLQDPIGLRKITEAGITLSKASRMEVAPALESLTTVMNQYGYEANKALYVVNKLTAGEIVGNVRTAEAAEMMKEFGANAKLSNVSLEESVALIQTLGKYMNKTKVDTASRNILTILSAAGGLDKAALSDLSKAGVNTGVLMDKSKTLSERLKELRKAAGNSVAMVHIFGKENLTAGQVVLENIELFDKFKNSIDKTNDAEKQAAINSISFINRVQELKNKFENLLIKGNETSGMLGFFGGIIGVITNNLGFLLGAIGTGLVLFAAWKTLMLAAATATTIFNVVTGISLALQGSYPIAMAANTVALTAFNVVTRAAAIGTAIFNAVLAVNPFVWIALAIVAVIAGIVLLIKNFDAVKGAVIGFVEYAWNGIKKVGQAILSYMLAPLQLVLKLISAVTGAEWAKNMQGKINDLTGQFSLDALTKEKEQPVNTLATANNEQKKIIEQNNNKNLNLTMVDKTKGGVNLIGNSAPMPNLQDTFSY